MKGQPLRVQTKEQFREAWLEYKFQVKKQADLYLSQEFQKLRLKAFAELGFNENRWAELESSVPAFSHRDCRNPSNLRNLLWP